MPALAALFKIARYALVLPFLLLLSAVCQMLFGIKTPQKILRLIRHAVSKGKYPDHATHETEITSLSV